jgi:hypothetical protein
VELELTIVLEEQENGSWAASAPDLSDEVVYGRDADDALDRLWAKLTEELN